MLTQFTTMIHLAELDLPAVPVRPQIAETLPAAPSAEAGVRQVTARLLRSGAAGGLRLAEWIDPESRAA